MAKHSGAALAPEDVEALLSDWLRLNEGIMDLPLEALRQLMQVERDGKRRLNVLNRLHERFNRLRAIRERHALAQFRLPWELT